MMLTQRHLLWYLIHHLPAWQQFTLIEPQRDSPPVNHSLDAVVQAYLRSSEKHPLFDEPVVIWWSDADHALLVPCRLQTNGSHLIEDAKVFRLVRTKPPVQDSEQAASL
jgi:hypothetical protein